MPWADSIRTARKATPLLPLLDQGLATRSMTRTGVPCPIVGGRPGTYDSCGLRNRLDYILLSTSLQQKFVRGAVFRKGLWGSRKTRPDDWATYPDMTESVEQASDHAAVYVELNI